MASPPLALYFELANCLYKLHQQNLPQVLICMSIHIAALPHKGFELFKQFFKCFSSPRFARTNNSLNAIILFTLHFVTNLLTSVTPMCADRIGFNA